jgi:hypothetical protein
MKACMTIVREMAVLKRRESNVKFDFTTTIYVENESCKVHSRSFSVAKFVLTDAESSLHLLLLLLLFLLLLLLLLLFVKIIRKRFQAVLLC